MPHHDPDHPFKADHHLPLTPGLMARLTVAYMTRRLAWKHAPGHEWEHITPNEFLTLLLERALDQDETLAGSKVALAGKVGHAISHKLDTQLLLLHALFDLLGRSATLSEADKNNSLNQAAADLDFEQRMQALRAFYQAARAPDQQVTPKPKGNTS